MLNLKSIRKVTLNICGALCGRRAWKFVVCNAVVIIGLLASYVYIFGLDSLRKYIEDDVIIIKREEYSPSIEPPG